MSPTTASKNRTHPMLIIAGAAIVLVSLTGTAAILGWLPSTGASNNANVATLASPAVPAQQAATHATHPRAASAPAVHRQPRAEPAHSAPALACGNCGVVESIREVSTRGDGSGLGAAGGAVVGGLLGNQVGGGHGKEAMTVVGAIGGAFAGNQIEKQARATRSYETTIRMSNGSSRTIAHAAAPEWHDGDRVKIVDGTVRMNG
ncbi:glycine zipper 2TM domain-containing protein [Massilia litorea]|uniref:Glycine zipper 2TM domain-containing protein n=2 Tax=Massilia litorea TaxID=2769491 RepID=A0A7L9UAG7_9BURK|nr:glycine zipper 2TM domain-containing protein [Massilia litorea]